MARKKKEKDALGKPVMNISFELICPSRFEDGKMFSVIDKVEMCGNAIHIAKKFLRGDWHVTERGYMLRGHKPELPCENIIVEVDGYNVEAIRVLEKILSGKIGSDDNMPRVHFHFLNNAVERIWLDKRGLYFSNMKQDYEYEQMKRQVLV